MPLTEGDKAIINQAASAAARQVIAEFRHEMEQSISIHAATCPTKRSTILGKGMLLGLSAAIAIVSSVGALLVQSLIGRPPK